MYSSDVLYNEGFDHMQCVHGGWGNYNCMVGGQICMYVVYRIDVHA